MAAGARRKKKRRSKKPKTERYVKYGWPGLLVGVVLGVLFMNNISSGRMLVSEKSPFGFDRTVTSIEAALPNFGFNHLGTYDAKKFLGTEYRLKMIRLLHPSETGNALDTDRSYACIIPTTIAVYETEELDIYVAYLRPSWARKIFGSRTAETLGSIVDEAVAAD